MTDRQSTGCPALAEAIREIQNRLGGDYASGIQVEPSSDYPGSYDVYFPGLGNEIADRMLWDMMRELYPEAGGEGVGDGTIFVLSQQELGGATTADAARRNLLDTLRNTDADALARRIGCRQAMAQNTQTLTATAAAYTGNTFTGLDATLPGARHTGAVVQSA